MARKRENHKITEQIESFLVDRAALQLAPGSIDFYSRYLGIFNNLVSERGAVSMEDLTADTLRHAMVKFGESHNKGGVHCLYRSVKVFCNWFDKETDYEWKNPIKKVEAPRVKLDPIPGVPVGDVRKMISACANNWLGKRDQAVLYFLLDTGVRLSEFCSLRMGDIDMPSGAVQVRNGKGDKDRVCFFGDETRAALTRYFRGRKDRTPESPVWLGRGRVELSTSGLRGIIRRRAADAGLKEEPSPHDFRRAFALNMLRNGADLLTVSTLLGHASLEVTKRYLAIDESDLARGHDAAGPVDRLRPKKKIYA